MSQSGRMRRVDVALREVLGDAIQQDLKDPRIGFVTVTAVNTSSDMRHATVWVSVLGDDAKRRLSMEGLRSAHAILQRRVSQEVRLKYTPQLEFKFDDTLDKAERIEQILRDGDQVDR